LCGGVPRYVAQAIPQIDAEIAEKGHLWMETSLDNHMAKACPWFGSPRVPPLGSSSSA
jgi:hypothetical protein